ncbi:MAG: exosortase F system-associated protein [Lutimonas sp.]
MDKKYRIAIILLLFLALVMVRAFESVLFYDPFILYFQDDFLHSPIPVFSGRNLLLSMSFRYLLNALISLLIIHVAFQNRSFTLFSVKFYVLAYVVLSVTFFIILKGELANGYLFAFYIRRFLIHPLFVLLLLPAFYYKQLTSNRII